MSSPTEIDRDGAGAVLAAMVGWPAGHEVHLGDVGWALRFEEDAPQRHRLFAWSNVDSGTVESVAIVEGQVIRTAGSPPADDIEALLEPGEAWVDTNPDSPLWTELRRRGWVLDEDRWAMFSHPLRSVPPLHEHEVVLDRETAADRVEVQRSAFPNSTFTVDRWELMTGSPGGAYCVDVIVRAPDGRPAAAATGWLGGPGQTAILEPVGTHRDFVRQGYGRRVVDSLGALLAERGAARIGVITPYRNASGVDFYQAAGYAVVGTHQALHRTNLDA